VNKQKGCIMKYAYFAVTSEGKALAVRMQEKFKGELQPISEVKSAYGKKDVLVFIMAAGIVTRLLAPLVESKTTDPAVLIIDQKGKFIIPLLSGHLGGANEHAVEIAEYLGAQEVITTATDLCQVLSFEGVARSNNLTIENPAALKQVNALLLQGASIELHTDHQIEWENPELDRDCLHILRYDPEDERAILRGFQMCAKEETAAVFLTSRALPAREDGTYPPNILILRPKDVIIGIGCRSLVNEEYVYQALKTALERQNLPEGAICRFATTSLKGREPAVLMLSERLGVPVELIDTEDIRKVEYLFIQSPFVQQVTNVGNISAPCAYISSGKGRMLMVRTTFPGGVTLAIAQERRSITL